MGLLLVGIPLLGGWGGLHRGWRMVGDSFPTSFSKTESCLHVYLPSSNACLQPLRSWWMVAPRLSHRRHRACTWIFQRHRLVGVGRVSEPHWKMNDSCPAGSPSTMRFHTLVLLLSLLCSASGLCIYVFMIS